VRKYDQVSGFGAPAYEVGVPDISFSCITNIRKNITDQSWKYL